MLVWWLYREGSIEGGREKRFDWHNAAPVIRGGCAGRRGEREIRLELARTQKLEFGHESKRGENVVWWRSTGDYYCVIGERKRLIGNGNT
jgi:hypothetical protein